MKTRISALFLALCLMLSCASCGTDPVQETSEPSATASQSEPSAATSQKETATPEPSTTTKITLPSASTSYYIGNINTKKFHKPTCSYLPDKSNQIIIETRSEAIADGYSPCGHCNP